MQLTDRQWKNLARDLQQQRCILLLGSRLAVEPGTDMPLHERLAQHLASVLEQEGIAYEKQSARRLHYVAQRFLTIPKIRRIDLEDEVVEFYRQHTQSIPEIYRQLAQLPFFLVVNTSPDDFMLRAFQQAGKTGACLLHFNLRREREAGLPVEFSPEQPLVYNLWGTPADPESLVLSQEDRVEFIKNVVKGNPAIPNRIMSCFDERKTYLFLGFNLENWDLRLLLDSFKLSRENTTLSPQLDNYPLRPETRSFYEDRYEFVFVEQEIGKFARELQASYAEHEQERTLPEPAGGEARRLVVLHHANDADQDCCRKLLGHLAPWVQEGRLEVWHPGSVLHGDIGQQMLQHIAGADVVLPVLSVDFVADIAQKSFIDEALRQHQARGLRIVPLLFRACPWDDTALAPFVPLPERDKPLRNWPDEDAAYTLVADRIKTLLRHE